ncbi:hypothetical protein H696_06235 [Fonticula alba]|uniref:Uncharacterized protein n=1 Tax=Fonticula alba TaxID=691883 RepID=A0A058YZN4_FONAL|nr:hypothetical protein H696_06235 [Fonticula alba]KCV67336.1 hypothetical protein H696_06235 [Fonticula alba]|eukprot:XP_009498258.1 hypothetical protein H696_06235 [Fonticula alba]
MPRRVRRGFVDSLVPGYLDDISSIGPLLGGGAPATGPRMLSWLLQCAPAEEFLHAPAVGGSLASARSHGRCALGDHWLLPVSGADVRKLLKAALGAGANRQTGRAAASLARKYPSLRHLAGEAAFKRDLPSPPAEGLPVMAELGESGALRTFGRAAVGQAGRVEATGGLALRGGPTGAPLSPGVQAALAESGQALVEVAALAAALERKAVPGREAQGDGGC